MIDNITSLTDEDLDVLDGQVRSEKLRRQALDGLPEEIAGLARLYVESGGDVEVAITAVRESQEE